MSTENQREGRWEGMREVLAMAGPVVLGAMSFTAMQFVDQYMVSWLGVEALAAIGSAGIWAYTLGVFFLGLSACVSTFVSQSLGRGDKANCANYAWQGIYLSFAAGSVTLLMWPFADSMFGFMGHSPEVTRLELIYFRIRLLGYVFIAWQTALACFFQATNRPVIPMYVAIAANIVNVALDYVLIFGKFGFPEWGIGGAAAATVISLGIQVALLQMVFMGPAYDREYGTRKRTRFDWGKMKDLIRIGWPSGVSQFVDVASWSIFTSILIGRFGTAQLAAHVAALNYIHITFIPAIGLNQAVTPVVGKWIGRGNVAIAKARAYTTTKIAMVYMLIVGTTLAVFGKPLITVFSSDPEVIRVGHTVLILAAVFAGFDAINVVLFGALRGVGDTRWLMGALLIGSYLVLLPLAYLFGVVFNLQAAGAWLGATIYIIALSGVVFRRFHGEKWRHIQIFSDDRPPEEPPVEAVAVEQSAP